MEKRISEDIDDIYANDDEEQDNYYVIEDIHHQTRCQIHKEKLSRFSVHLDKLDLSDISKTELSNAINMIQADPKQFVEIFSKHRKDLEETKSRENPKEIPFQDFDNLIRYRHGDRTNQGTSTQYVDVDVSIKSNYYLTPSIGTPTVPKTPRPGRKGSLPKLPRKPSFQQPPIIDVIETPSTTNYCYCVCEYLLLTVGATNILTWIFVVLVVFNVVDNLLYTGELL